MKNFQLSISDIRSWICLFGLLLFLLILLPSGCARDEKKNVNLSIIESESARREIIGERLYQRYCSGCHGTTGEGDGLHSYTLNPPPANYADTAYMNSLSDEYLFEIISNGGASVDKSTEMPRWKDVLGRNDINNVIIYLRKFPLPIRR
ncbi:MAG TPA: cytochrome c [Patescibacteria group bacterium]|nr:cytochrome c [Patescibacteria group bacterium]